MWVNLSITIIMLISYDPLKKIRILESMLT